MTTAEPDGPIGDINTLAGQQWVFTAPEAIGLASIRKFALAVGDSNPLYYDAGYASTSQYGGIIAPPTFVCETMQFMSGEMDETGDPTQKPKLPLGTEIRGGNEYNLLRPLRPEDVLTVRWKLSDVREREGKSGKLIIVVSEITYTNQYHETVATNNETTLFRISDSETDGGRQSGLATMGRSTGGPGPAARRLETPLLFEDADVGDEIGALSKEITLPGMVFYGAATWDFNRSHYDYEYVQRRGFSRPFVDGQMLGAFLAQMLADWTGDPGAISKLGFRFRDFAYPGDVLTCRGRVTSKSSQGGQNLVECELWVENQEGALVLSPGHATLKLPSEGL